MDRNQGGCGGIIVHLVILYFAVQLFPQFFPADIETMIVLLFQYGLIPVISLASLTFLCFYFGYYWDFLITKIVPLCAIIVGIGVYILVFWTQASIFALSVVDKQFAWWIGLILMFLVGLGIPLIILGITSVGSLLNHAGETLVGNSEADSLVRKIIILSLITIGAGTLFGYSLLHVASGLITTVVVFSLIVMLYNKIIHSRAIPKTIHHVVVTALSLYLIFTLFGLFISQ